MPPRSRPGCHLSGRRVCGSAAGGVGGGAGRLTGGSYTAGHGTGRSAQADSLNGEILAEPLISHAHNHANQR